MREEILYAQHAALCYVVEVVNVLPTRTASARALCAAHRPGAAAGPA